MRKTRVEGRRYQAGMQVAEPRLKSTPVIKLAACPDCRQPEGSRCVSASGAVKSTHCRSRARMAARALNLQPA